jgi:hypothetical protein
LSYDDSQRRELREAFTVMMDYVRTAHEKGSSSGSARTATSEAGRCSQN